MPHDARAIANFLLDYGDSIGKGIAHLSLHKIIYFAHGWHLAEYNQPLIANPFEAWEHGPVVKVIYDQFKSTPKYDFVRTRAQEQDLLTGQTRVVSYELNNSEKDFIVSNFTIYGMISPYELSEMTHLSGSPWDQIWNLEVNKPKAGMRISNELIRNYFLQISQHVVTH